ncbi:fumarylacetoacetate hydrolase family protein [Haliea sp. E1-2-M8]|uniref:2-keto-4-pentenoate hydratase n=1 Tax=Haliea sp. E1-2-M8 TaxID=3064706 RepID=UPI002720A5DF|nr:fumarylacetoacetate hydrolase family protein [Haliea sp. E1-2-M8]MDO8863786.1 fumarylacetoacetate hydrolase family protein [Haliea sp. E1-2-M8]
MNSNDMQHLSEDRDHIAAKLRIAVRDRALIEPVRNEISDPSDALAKSIQRANIDFWVKEGRRIVGSKVGITSRAAQEQFGIDSPAYGTLFADMVETDGASIDANVVSQLRVEAEIAFVLNSDIDNPNTTIVDVISAIDYGLPAIELVSSRIRDWDLKLFDFIADNAAASMIVLGETPFDIQSCDVRTLGTVTTINGNHRSFGSGGAYLGSPLQSLLWLARERVTDGNPLRRGEVVMTGALGPIISSGKGAFIDVRIGHLPPVIVEIT